MHGTRLNEPRKQAKSDQDIGDTIGPKNLNLQARNLPKTPPLPNPLSL